jgi:RimJ/RimL family protein N-acetyltransferase
MISMGDHTAPAQGWLHAPLGAAQEIARAVCAPVPVFTTERLNLRAPKITDYPAYETVFVSNRAQFMGGPFTAEEAFSDFCQGVAGWALRGAGMWTMTARGSDDAPLGWIYLWQEMGDPEPELGWVLTAEAEGKGYAREAAFAVLPYAVQVFGPQRFVSYIDAGNERSARLARDLGAVRDLMAEAQMATLGEVDLHVYRHSGQPILQGASQ